MTAPKFNQVTIVTEAVRAEGRRWGPMADDLAKVASTVDSRSLFVTAFWIGKPGDFDGAIAFETYKLRRESILSPSARASPSSSRSADALKRIGDLYDQQDEIAALDLEAAYSVPKKP
jgi:hypothetical protein